MRKPEKGKLVPAQLFKTPNTQCQTPLTLIPFEDFYMSMIFYAFIFLISFPIDQFFFFSYSFLFRQIKGSYQLIHAHQLINPEVPKLTKQTTGVLPRAFLLAM